MRNMATWDTFKTVDSQRRKALSLGDNASAPKIKLHAILKLKWLKRTWQLRSPILSTLSPFQAQPHRELKNEWLRGETYPVPPHTLLFQPFLSCILPPKQPNLRDYEDQWKASTLTVKIRVEEDQNGASNATNQKGVQAREKSYHFKLINLVKRYKL